LDVYYPADKKDFAAVVWFHGGGLSGGEKFVPAQLKNQGMAEPAHTILLKHIKKNKGQVD